MKAESCHYIETSQSICSANQLTGFNLIATFNGLINFSLEISITNIYKYQETF